MFALMLALLVIFGGIAALVLSFPPSLTPEYLVLASIAAFTLSCALSLWGIGIAVINYTERKKKNG